MPTQGATVGLVGFGGIGQTLARLLRPFGCRILYTGPREKPDAAEEVGAVFVPELVDLLRESDIVSLHCPLTPSTNKLIGAAQLEAMKPEAVLVNTARGDVVDQDALVHALSNGIIAGAGLDVTSPEPLPPSHALFGLPNCVILPHIGSATFSTRNAMVDLAVANTIAALRGEPIPHRV